MGLTAVLSAALAAYCRLVARRPCLLMLLYTALVAAVIGLSWRPLEVESDFSSFIRADGPAMRQRDAYLLALSQKKGPEGRRLQADESSDAAPAAGLSGGGDVAVRPTGDGLAWWEPRGRMLQMADAAVVAQFELTLIYEAESGNAFEERVLREVRDLELRLRSLPGWRDFCGKRTWGPHRRYCDPGETLAAYAWPSQVAPSSGESGRLFALRFDAQGSEPLPVPAMLAYLQRREHEAHGLERFFPADFHPPVPSDNQTDLGWARIVGPREFRTHYTFNVDLTQAALSRSTAELQAAASSSREAYRRLIVEEVSPLLSQAEASLQSVKVRYYGAVISGHEVSESLKGDVLWAVGAGLLVAASLWLHSRSLFVSVFSWVLVFLAVPLAYVMTPAAKTTIASFLSLFLIAGIGSDVVFVFCDFWEQSKAHCMEDDLGHRLSWMLAHAGVNCLATSATTAASFLANLASVLQPLREFGLFMGLCVMGAFVLLTFFLPPVFVLRARHRERALARKLKKTAPDPAAATGPPAPAPALEDASVLSSVVPAPAAESAASAPQTPPSAGSAPPPPPRRRSCTEAALLFAMRRIEACPAVLLAGSCLCTLGFGIAAGLLAELDQGMPEVFPEGHNQFEVHRLQDRFATVPQLSLMTFRSPRAVGAACAANASSAFNSNEPCSLHWCDAGSTMQPSNAGGSCWRSPTWGASADGSEWRTDSCSRLTLSTRVAAPSQPEGWLPAAHGLLQRIADPGLEESGSSALGVAGLPPLVFEDWSTGRVGTSPFFDMGVLTASRNVSADGQQCQIEVLCFLGPQVCSLPDWRSLGPPSLQPPALGPSPRSLLQAAATVPRHKRIDVTVLWGLRAARYTPLVGALDQPWSFDPGFDLRDPWAQRAVQSFCANQPADLGIVADGSSCWIDEFRFSLLRRGQRFPSRDFSRQAIAFHGQTVTASEHLWYVDGHVKAAKLVFVVDVAKDVGSRAVLKYKEKWDSFVNERNGRASCTANQAWHTTSAWVLAEAEVAVVDSTVSTILISAVCGFVGMLAFTGDPMLAFMVLLLVLGVISSLAFFMVAIMGWKLGPVEVISLVVFVGYSVTYSLHIAHLYSKAGVEAVEETHSRDRSAPAAKACDACGGDGCPFCQFHGREQAPRSTTWQMPPIAELRRARVRSAVLRVGGATLSSAASTIGSSFFLLFCTLRIFTKLGAVVIAVASLSCFFSLTALPAALLLVGPGPGPWHQRCARYVSALRRRPRSSDSRLLE